MVKIATSAYALSPLSSWAEYEDKIADWVARAAKEGSDLLVFPEYAAMELATLAGPQTASDLEAASHAVSERLPEADTLHRKLAREFQVHILAGSAPCFDASVHASRPVNRARLFTPSGEMGVQDKQIMTRFEAEIWDVVPGGPLRLFDTSLGKIGILICYDSEFPLLGRALSEADIILVPSVTEALCGHTRVCIGSRARALEQQCITAMSSLVGTAHWTEAVDVSVGRGGIFAPPDKGFPETGIIAQGDLNVPAWTYGEVDLAQIHHVRQDGGVLNRRDWAGQERSGPEPERVTLTTQMEPA